MKIEEIDNQPNLKELAGNQKILKKMMPVLVIAGDLLITVACHLLGYFISEKIIR